MSDASQAYIDALVNELGATELVPSHESAPSSVWVCDDDAPHGVAGYYEKRRIPLRHRTVSDGRAVAFDFWIDGVAYRIRCSHHADAERNLDEIATTLRVLRLWATLGIVTWENALTAFRREYGDVTREWWQILRVPPDATCAEIDAGYRRQARTTHPDGGGTHEAFLELRKALAEGRANAGCA